MGNIFPYLALCARFKSGINYEVSEMEIWKDIQGYEDLYEVSNTGLVRSKDRTITNKNGKPQFYPAKELKFDITHHNSSSYARVTLSKNHKTKRFSVHRLVAEAFIPNLDNKECVNHLDNNALNNNVSNLEWCTHGENMMHAQKQNRLFASQSKAGKKAGVLALQKLNKKIDALQNTQVNAWKVLGTIREKRKSKWYTNAVCQCGTEALIDVGRLLRFEATSCKSCSKLQKMKI